MGKFLKRNPTQIASVKVMDNLPTTLSGVQKTVNDWITQFEEGYWPPLSMLAAMTEEIGELAREINHREGYKKKRVGGEGDLGLEIADVLFSLTCIANYYHIDIDKAFKAAMEKYSKRDMNRWTKKVPDKRMLEP